ncbi:type II secretion system protein [Salinicola halophilus]|uniref:type II secretion system protein n=1 Tax=Salinicola halophilus TaxID=184065 RepID=UPI000DA1F7BE|nr:type II secretion system protein [Salinicola halophilus]
MTRQRGFTLLEMLAAIVLMVVFASVLLGAYAQSARSLAQVAANDRLDVAARSVLDDLRGQPLVVGTRHGQWDGFDWTLVTKRRNEVAGAAGRLVLYRLTLRVSDGRRQRDYATLRTRMATTP